MPNWMEAASAFANLASVAVAVGALTVAFVANRRNAQHFESQLAAQQRQMEESARPILDVITGHWSNHKYVTVLNCGVGTAVIKSVFFRNGNGESSENLANIFSLPSDIKWDSWYCFRLPKPLRAGDSLVLVQLTEENILEQKVSQTRAAEVLAQYEAEVAGTTIAIDYEDVFGNPQPQARHEVVAPQKPARLHRGVKLGLI